MSNLKGWDHGQGDRQRRVLSTDINGHRGWNPHHQRDTGGDRMSRFFSTTEKVG